MNIHSLYKLLFLWFRRRRMARFVETFRVGPETRILDIGGTAYNWRFIGYPGRVTVLNIDLPPDLAEFPANMTFQQGDATRLPYRDGSFDVVFSNSVIEHLHDWRSQQAFAAEALRVGRGLWVQTPARSFPVEPHLITPLVHYLPRSWQRRLLRNFSVWGLMTRPTQAQVDDFLEEVRLLGREEVETLFPGCEIRRESFLLLTKAYVAVRRLERTVAAGGSGPT